MPCRGIEGPGINEGLKYIALHRDVNSRRGTDRGHDRLKSPRKVFSRRPLCKAFVAAAEHTHTPIAPPPGCDPVDQCVRICAIMFVGRGLVGSTPFAAREPLHARIPIRCRSASFVHERDWVSIDCEVE